MMGLWYNISSQFTGDKKRFCSFKFQVITIFYCLSRKTKALRLCLMRKLVSPLEYIIFLISGCKDRIQRAFENDWQKKAMQSRVDEVSTS